MRMVLIPRQQGTRVVLTLILAATSKILLLECVYGVLYYQLPPILAYLNPDQCCPSLFVQSFAQLLRRTDKTVSNSYPRAIYRIDEL